MVSISMCLLMILNYILHSTRGGGGSISKSVPPCSTLKTTSTAMSNWYQAMDASQFPESEWRQKMMVYQESTIVWPILQLSTFLSIKKQIPWLFPDLLLQLLNFFQVLQPFQVAGNPVVFFLSIWNLIPIEFL